MSKEECWRFSLYNFLFAPVMNIIVYQIAHMEVSLLINVEDTKH